MIICPSCQQPRLRSIIADVNTASVGRARANELWLDLGGWPDSNMPVPDRRNVRSAYFSMLYDHLPEIITSDPSEIRIICATCWAKFHPSEVGYLPFELLSDQRTINGDMQHCLATYPDLSQWSKTQGCSCRLQAGRATKTFPGVFTFDGTRMWTACLSGEGRCQHPPSPM